MTDIKTLGNYIDLILSYKKNFKTLEDKPNTHQMEN